MNSTVVACTQWVLVTFELTCFPPEKKPSMQPACTKWPQYPHLHCHGVSCILENDKRINGQKFKVQLVFLFYMCNFGGWSIVHIVLWKIIIIWCLFQTASGWTWTCYKHLSSNPTPVKLLLGVWSLVGRINLTSKFTEEAANVEGWVVESAVLQVNQCDITWKEGGKTSRKVSRVSDQPSDRSIFEQL